MTTMWARVRGVGLWFATGFDDFVVERTWGRLRRGDPGGALRVWTDLITGFWGCAVIFAALIAAVVTVVVVMV